MDVYKILGKRKILKDMKDDEFESFLPEFCKALVSIGFDTLLKNYNNKLKSNEKDWENLKKKEITKNNINSTSIVGMNIIKRHMPHIYEVENYKGKSIKKMWTYESIIKAVRTNRKSHSTPYFTEIVRQVGFTSGTSKVTMYRPLLTKRIIQYFNATNVLDVCVGWGGRMLGSLCIDGVSYTGIEPFSKTYEGLDKMKNDLNLDKATLYNKRAEEQLPLLPNNHYDIALTSPPYYNLEIYSDETSQSHHYGTYEEWIERFLKPVVYGVLEKLKDDGKSCWSVKNFKTDKKYNLYDDIVKLHEDKGWKKMDIEFYVGNCTNPGVNAKNSKKITKQKKKIKALEEYIEKLENKPKKDDLSKEEFIDDISLLESIKKIISDLKDQLKKDLKILASLEKEYKKKKGKEITYVFEKIG
tara:strand:+ start:1176 stop:2414 length:1239 start_codon:yes stop_codon:yes gene_type:complete